MSFGYAIGDFIAGANLAYQLIKVMTETRGACPEYQEAMTELCAIQQAFIHVSQVIQSNTLPKAALNSASHIVMSSMDIIATFLDRTKDYRRKLERADTGGVSGSWCKMGWALYKKEELKTLRDSLHCRLVAINTLFAAANHIYAVPPTIEKFQVSDEDQESVTSFADSAVFITKDLDQSPLSDAANPSQSRPELECRVDKSRPTTQAPDLQTKVVNRPGGMYPPVNRAPGSPPEHPTSPGWKTYHNQQQAMVRTGDFEILFQQRLGAEKRIWKAEQFAADEERRIKAEELAKLEGEKKARIKLANEKQAAEKAALDAEEKKRTEDEFKKKILAEAKTKIQLDLKKTAKEPIKFKDAVGRKFSFPFHLCQTWPGMEELIKQAFLHVDIIGTDVQKGWYDLIVPNGEVILPTVWERVIEPGMIITMHMWPSDQTLPRPLPPRRPLWVQGSPPPKVKSLESNVSGGPVSRINTADKRQNRGRLADKIKI